MKNDLNEKALELRYPSVEHAYDFVKPSYDWMVTRLEAINSKIQGLLTFAATITAAIPVIAKAIFNDANFHSVWFYLVIASFAFLVIVGVIGLRVGKIILLSPKILYDKCLHYPQWEFKRIVIYWAGEHLDENKKLVDKKASFRDVMTIALLVEILCICLWIAF